MYLIVVLVMGIISTTLLILLIAPLLKKVGKNCKKEEAVPLNTTYTKRWGESGLVGDKDTEVREGSSENASYVNSEVIIEALYSNKELYKKRVAETPELGIAASGTADDTYMIMTEADEDIGEEEADEDKEKNSEISDEIYVSMNGVGSHSERKNKRQDKETGSKVSGEVNVMVNRNGLNIEEGDEKGNEERSFGIPDYVLVKSNRNSLCSKAEEEKEDEERDSEISDVIYVNMGHAVKDRTQKKP